MWLRRVGNWRKPSTGGRSEDLFRTPQEAAEELELDPEDAAKLRWAALIHDIGKLEVPERILNKDGRPTDRRGVGDHPWPSRRRSGTSRQPDAVVG